MTIPIVDQESKQNAIIPDLPRDMMLIDANGNLTGQWALFFDQLITVLQQTISPEGILLPPQSADNIAILTGASSVGRALYNTTTNLPMNNVLVGSTPTWKTVALT